jgi:hypothetical protein
LEAGTVADKECCPKFDPEPWHEREFTWDDKPFIRDYVRQILHIPLNFGKVITGMMNKIEAAGAMPDEYIMLAYDPSAWKCELYVAVSKDVPNAENVRLSGTYLTRVFDGPYKDCGRFFKETQDYARTKGKEAKKVFFYFTTCPKCAKLHGHNYMVGFAEV